MAINPATPKTGSRETLWAIIGSFVVAIILASLLTGNPFRSLGRAYFDYTHEPRGGSTTAVGPGGVAPPAQPAAPATAPAK